MIRKSLVGLGLAAAASVPAIYAATRPGEIRRPSAPAPVTSKALETITCPITGEEIPPCCCPLTKRK